MTPKRTAAQIVDAVADAAHELLVERSPSAVSLREIAAAAQVNLGLIHRYVGSKDDVIALVLARHTRRVRSTSELSPPELVRQVSDAIVNYPATGRLMGGMILDGVDVAALKDEFPLLQQLAKSGDPTNAAITYALVLGWEVFGPTLLGALETNPDADDLVDALALAINTVQAPGAQNSAP